METTENELTIVAHVRVYPEYKDELAPAFRAIVEGTRKESGNISYILYEDIDNPLNLTFVEEWKSKEAIEAHNKSVHFLEFAKAVEGKADLDVVVLKQKQ
ncbi:MAG: antibiotic biosynthesis monooxygenase [Cytophagaceae bacterium]|nr:antibiotic biosynthesis monooxygenase [Cytophagaceae bacterium]